MLVLLRMGTSMVSSYKFLLILWKHFLGYLVYEKFLWPESWPGSLHIYLPSFPRFWTLLIEPFWFLGTGYYLCRGGRGKGKKERGGGGNQGYFRLAKWGSKNYLVRCLGGSAVWSRGIFKRCPLAKMGKVEDKQYMRNSNAKLFNFMLILLLFVYLNHHYFVQLNLLYLTV